MCAGRAFRMLQNIIDLSSDFNKGTFQFIWGLQLPYLSHAANIFVLHPSLQVFSFSFHLDKYIFVKCLCDLDEKCIFIMCSIVVETRIFVTMCKAMPKSDKTELKWGFQSHICLYFLNLVHVFMLADHA